MTFVMQRRLRVFTAQSVLSLPSTHSEEIMTAVVTGAAGHVGGNLVRALLARGESVRVLVHRDRGAFRGLDVEFAQGDVGDPDSLRNAFAGADVVYHLAGRVSVLMTDWWPTWTVNVIGTRNVVQACLQSGVCRLIHFSSVHAMRQRRRSGPVDESGPLVTSGWAGPYAFTKAQGEKIVQRAAERGLDAVILRPTGIIGPYDYRPSHFGEALLAIAQGKWPALVTGGFDWVDARDVAGAAIAAADRAPAGSVYMVSGNWESVVDMARAVGEVMGIAVPSIVFPLGLTRVVAPLAAPVAQALGKRPLFTTVSVSALGGGQHVSHERASRDLGYGPRPFHDTIADTLRWFEENGYLSRA
jgi:dihydroflavonol-4-reductase